MFHWLFDTSPFVTRTACGPGWTPSLVYVNHLGNVLTFLAYVAIPVTLMFAWRWLKYAPEGYVLRNFPRWPVAAFAAFILACGVGHALDVLVFYTAPYRALTAWRVVTGVSSWVGFAGGVVGLRWLLYEYGRLKGVQIQLVSDQNKALETAVANLERLKVEYDAQGKELASREAEANSLLDQLARFKTWQDDSAVYRNLQDRLEALKG